LPPPETITFSCPSCSIRLTVPSQLAGVNGPCPSCQVLIQAPYARPSTQQPARYNSPIQDFRESARPENRAEYHQRQNPAPRPDSRFVPPSTGREQRSSGHPVRRRIEPSGDAPKPRVGSPGPPPRRRRGNSLLRFAVPACFLLLVAGVAFGVKTFLEMDRDGGKSTAVKEVLQEEDSDDSFEKLTAGDQGDTAEILGSVNLCL